MSTISILNKGILDIKADAVVNAANEGLFAGSGVCGVLFRAAGHSELERACRKIGHCDTGSAVITKGFELEAAYIVHAVGPVWYGGNDGEREKLKGAYDSSLVLAKENDIHSIVFPLISAGIFGYPKDEAWTVAISSCRTFIERESDYDIDIYFAIPDRAIMEIGLEKLKDEGLDIL